MFLITLVLTVEFLEYLKAVLFDWRELEEPATPLHLIETPKEYIPVVQRSITFPVKLKDMLKPRRRRHKKHRRSLKSSKTEESVERHSVTFAFELQD
ncbi:hypothetical protein OESDEN_20788 [Oesophagostomum dentatum]|uniref:Uncharacterized protein n=1 Tax=Oesophagostomum dentatum TaxID=61180 RepID=A0A0B1S8L2_OESDE|nr:hypothetical protein OESDEN_20788 [Oesophagostomum dentatum]